MAEEKVWLTLSQMAERLQVTPKTFRKYVVEHYIPCIALGRSLRFDPEIVERKLEKIFEKIESTSFKGTKNKIEIHNEAERDFFRRELGLID